MTRDSIQRAGRILADAWMADETVDFPTDLLPVDRDASYAAQDEMARLVAMETGNAVVGWKVGATSLGVQEAEGYDGPIPGRIFASTIYGNRSSVPLTRCQQANIEVEVAFRFHTAPSKEDGGLSHESLAKIVTAMPAFDITGTRYTPSSRESWGNQQNMLAGIADNGNGGAVVLGSEKPLRKEFDFVQLQVELSINGGDPVANLWNQARGDPLEALVWTVNQVYERGFALAAGDVVLTGSLTVPQRLRPGDRVVCHMSGLGGLSFQVRRA